MWGLRVRRLAAVDMYGTTGARWRRRVVAGEFVVGAAGGVVLGLWIALSAKTVGGQLFGAWLVGMGVNYLALTWHAVSLSRPGVLDAELAGVDARAELRRYGPAQLWLLIPTAVAWFALVQVRRSSPPPASSGAAPRER